MLSQNFLSQSKATRFASRDPPPAQGSPGPDLDRVPIPPSHDGRAQMTTGKPRQITGEAS